MQQCTINKLKASMFRQMFVSRCVINVFGVKDKHNVVAEGSLVSLRQEMCCQATIKHEKKIPG